MDISKIISRLEKEYAEEKEKECEELHNAIADVMIQQKATVQNSLFVLEIIKFELLRAKYEEVFTGSIKLSDDRPPVSKMQFKSKKDS